MQQNAFVDVDCYTPLAKQHAMLDLIFTYEEQARRAIAAGVDIEDICNLPVHESIGRAKSVENEQYQTEFAAILKEIRAQVDRLIEAVEKD